MGSTKQVTDLQAARLLCIAAFVSHVHTVSIAPVKGPVVVYSSSPYAVLPCKFTTQNCPEVTWYRLQYGKRNLVVQRSMEGIHQVSEEFRDRIGFGYTGDLILIKPEVHDSDNYSCEVDVDYENPSWAKVEMELIVTEHTTTMTATDSTTAPVTAILCAVDRGVLCALFCLGMVLVLVSILCLADSLCSSVADNHTDNLKAGLTTGITGNVILVVIVVLVCQREKILKRWIPTQDRRKEITEEGVTQQAEEENETHEEITETSPLHNLGSQNSEDENTENSSKESSDMTPASGSYHTETKEHQPKILQNPSLERVVGMVSTSYKDVYFCTETKIFYRDVERNSNNYDEISTALSGKYVTVSRSKDGIVVTTQSRKKKSKVPLLFIPERKEKAYNMDVHFEGKQPWICVDPDGEHMYLTDFEGGRLVRTGPTGHKKEDIGIGVLKNPACVVQNQSGSLIVADPSKSDLFVFQKTGSFVTTVKISMPVNQVNEMKGCDKMAIGEDGKIFVSSPYSKNVLVFSADFRFDRIIPTGTETSGVISSLMVVKDSLYVAHEDCIRIYPI